MTHMPEEWRAVVGFEGRYEVSNHGRVRSVPHVLTYKDGRQRLNPGKVLKLQARDARYLSVSLDGQSHRVHQLVADAFIGPCPDGCIVLHRDDDGYHNAATNLRYGTHGENRVDARHNRAASTGLARRDGRLSPADAACIKGLLGDVPVREIARRYGVSRGCVAGIQRGRNWSDVEPLPVADARRELDRRLVDQRERR